LVTLNAHVNLLQKKNTWAHFVHHLDIIASGAYKLLL